MAGFSTEGNIVSAVSADSQENVAFFRKLGTAPETGGEWYSFWKDSGTPGAGSNPAGGSGTPGAGGTAYDLDPGGLWVWDDVEGSGKQRYLTEFSAWSDGLRTTYMLFDRLVGVGNI